MTTTIRAKFRVTSITERQYGGKLIGFHCQYDDKIPEDQRFYKATPSGRVEMQIDNPVAIEAFQLGAYFYADFTPVPVAEAPAAAAA